MVEHKDLLELLELPDDDFAAWLSDYFTKQYFETKEWPKWYGVCDILLHKTFPGREIIYADLAFRLRNEVLNLPDEKGEYWGNALTIVAKYVTKNEVWEIRDSIDVDTWFMWFAQPKHWIIAALIARRLSERSK